MSDWIPVPKEVVEAAELAALKAAISALGDLSKQEDHRAIARAIATAFKAIRRVAGDAEKEFGRERAQDGQRAHIYLDEHWIAATAYLIAIGVLDNDAHPYSRFGEHMLAFVKAVSALNAVSDALSFLEDGDVSTGLYGAYHADDLLALMGQENGS